MDMERRANPAGERVPIRVLVVGTDDWAIEQASGLLNADGFTVIHCHPLNEPEFPCNALVDGRECPLVLGFDVVVDVRARPLDGPVPGEMGVVCGLQRLVPLVTAGMSWRNPFTPWAECAVGDEDDLVAAVHEVLASRAASVDLTVTAVGVVSPNVS